MIPLRFLLLLIFTATAMGMQAAVESRLTGEVELHAYPTLAIEGVSASAMRDYQTQLTGRFRVEWTGLPDGAAVARLSAAELQYEEAGRRVFSVMSAGGDTALAGVDWYALAGFGHRAEVRFPVTISGGRLSLSFQRNQGEPAFSVVEILNSGGSVLARLNARETVLPNAGETSVASPLQPTPAQLSRLASWLPRKPAGVGRPVSDRTAWARAARHPSLLQAVPRAEFALLQPVPDLTDTLYLQYSTSGSREGYEEPFRRRTEQLTVLALGECVENKGRFLPSIIRLIEAVLAEKTWVLPAHDPDLLIWKGERASVDLASSVRAWTLATVDHWLGEKLPPELRTRLRVAVRNRVIEPYLKNVRGTPSMQGFGWMRSANNWNAVCHAGVVGAGLALVESPDERAWLLAGVENYLQRVYLSGFSDDGYCWEGLAYWNYGFGSYLLLAETVYAATGGRMDLLAGDKVRRVASYPERLEIIDGVYPVYADGGLGTRPSGWILDLLAGRGLINSKPSAENIPVHFGFGGAPYLTGLLGFPARPFLPRPDKAAAPVPRDRFDTAGVFTFRPGTGASAAFAVSTKGGNNGGSHHHNDLGSFVVVQQGRALLLDPGMEVYTKRTFGPERYESKVISSYGHSVPRVAGRLQETGAIHAARVAVTKFDDQRDELQYDLSGGYDVPGLERLVRTCVYTRGDRPSFTVSDSVRFGTPQAFGTALVTTSKWKQTAPDVLQIWDGSSGIEVRIRSEGAGFSITSEPLDERLPGGFKATRLGIDMDHPVKEGEIHVEITPFAAEAGIFQTGERLPAGRSVLPTGAVRLEGENFSRQEGGKVEPVARVAASGLGVRFWDNPGHRLTWRFQLPEAGDHVIALRHAHAGADMALRRARIDGKPVSGDDIEHAFPPTGGWSGDEDNWKTLWLGRNGEAMPVHLAAGPHELTLINVSGALNLDWVEITPVK